MESVLNDAFSPVDSNVKIILHFRSRLTERYCSGIRRIKGNVSEGQGCSSVVEHTDGVPSECPWFNPWHYEANQRNKYPVPFPQEVKGNIQNFIKNLILEESSLTNIGILLFLSVLNQTSVAPSSFSHSLSFPFCLADATSLGQCFFLFLPWLPLCSIAKYIQSGFLWSCTWVRRDDSMSRSMMSKFRGKHNFDITPCSVAVTHGQSYVMAILLHTSAKSPRVFGFATERNFRISRGEAELEFIKVHFWHLV